MIIHFKDLETLHGRCQPDLEIAVKNKTLTCKDAEILSGKMNGRCVSFKAYHTTFESGVMEILARALASAEQIQHIELGSCRIGDADLQILTNALKEKTIESIDLSGNAFKVESISTLLKTVSISGVSLWDNNLGPDGAEEVIRAFTTNPNGKWINLSHNLIGNEGAKKIASCLAENPGQLEALYLFYNWIGLEGDLALAEQVPATVKTIAYRTENNEGSDLETLKRENPMAALVALSRAQKNMTTWGKLFPSTREGLIHPRVHRPMDEPDEATRNHQLATLLGFI